MQITIAPTKDIESVNGSPCRRWVGKTDKGVPIIAWITTVQPQTHDETTAREFAAELREVRSEVVNVGMDLRLFTD